MKRQEGHSLSLLSQGKLQLDRQQFLFFEERCQLRAAYLQHLEDSLARSEDDLHFNELLEDDELSKVFLDARAAGQDPVTVLPMVLKAEGDATRGHVCYLGPRAVEFCLGKLNLDIGVATVEQLLRPRLCPGLSQSRTRTNIGSLCGGRQLVQITRAGIGCEVRATTCMWRGTHLQLKPVKLGLTAPP